ncbi:hypothetical protein B0H13DRAFT_1897219 [Mycena leptocephala]|nr:hypothetical protein B0H13DRAFT_1897219 [Mycena leptocephala]
MSGAIVPQWLTSLDTMKSLLQFLSEPGISALTKDIYNVDFHPGVHGSYVYPESACTKDDVLITLTVFSDANGKFRIEGGGPTASPSFEAFARQMSQLARIVKEGDDKDADIGQDSDSNRVDMAGGTCIEIELGFPPYTFSEAHGSQGLKTVLLPAGRCTPFKKVIYSYTRYVGECPEVAKVGDMAVRTPQQWYTYFQDAWHLAAFGTNHPSRSQHQTTDQGCLNLLLLANLLSFPRFSVVADSPNMGITNSRRRTRFWLDISV